MSCSPFIPFFQLEENKFFLEIIFNFFQFFPFSEKHVYVTKPLDKHPNSWRRSFSREEKDLLKKIDTGNLVKREVARTIKAIFKRRWKNIPSYAIKTALFHFCFHQNKIDWTSQGYPYRVFDLLAFLQGYLHEKWLPNYFLKNQNLLEKYEDVNLENISTGIKSVLSSEKKILKLLNSDGEL